MRAMILQRPGAELREVELDEPRPGAGEVVIEVEACGVCRTDLHIIDGELDEPKLPLVLGHQIVGRVIAAGEGAEAPEVGARVGVPWLGWACGECRWCRADRENLCENAVFTGYGRDGGYAVRALADAEFCLALGFEQPAPQLAPLLCGGLIGYRALRFCGEAERLGLYGFGSAAHMIAQVAIDQGRRVFAFTRDGDDQGQEFARELGAEWAGGSSESPGEQLDAAIIFAPVGELVPRALGALGPAGTVVCAGIHMSQIPAFDYSLLWRERSVRSVANLTRADGAEFLSLAAEVPVRTAVSEYPLSEANSALSDLRDGRVRGSAVLVPPQSEQE